MKRTISRPISISVILLLILSMLLLTSCGEESNQDLTDSKYVGTWKATNASIMNAETDVEEPLILTLNGDGTGTLSDTESTNKLTWSLTKDGFKTKGDTKLTFTDDGDNIKTKIIGVEMVFVRQ